VVGVKLRGAPERATAGGEAEVKSPSKNNKTVNKIPKTFEFHRECSVCLRAFSG
jgi:hypothetical protein